MLFYFYNGPEGLPVVPKIKLWALLHMKMRIFRALMPTGICENRLFIYCYIVFFIRLTSRFWSFLVFDNGAITFDFATAFDFVGYFRF